MRAFKDGDLEKKVLGPIHFSGGTYFDGVMKWVVKVSYGKSIFLPLAKFNSFFKSLI